MAAKTASQLIEARLKEMPMDMAYPDDMESEYKYTCMDTGLMFETYGEMASYSPFTGSMNISMMESVREQDSQKPTGIPASQANPMQQTPVAANPAPAGAPNWMNTPVSGNPAPDAQNLIGTVAADGQGYVPYPQQSVPPYTQMQPGMKTG